MLAENKVVIQSVITSDLKEWLVNKALEDGRTISNFVARILQDYQSKEEYKEGIKKQLG